MLAVAVGGCGSDRSTQVSDSGSGEPPVTVDAPVEAGSAEAAVDAAVEAGSAEAAVDAPTTDDSGIDLRSCLRDAGTVTFGDGGNTITFDGCLPCWGSPAVTGSLPFAPNINIDLIGESFVCTAASDFELVRIKACAALRDNPLTAGEELTYCAIVDVPRELLSSLADGSELALDGTTAFAFDSSSDEQVLPENVDYIAARPTPSARRVWLEKICSCSAGGLTGTQELKGRLRIDERSTERIAGELKLSASGMISPTTDLRQTVGLLMHFDMPIVARAR